MAPSFTFCEVTFPVGVLNPSGTVQIRSWEPGLLRDFYKLQGTHIIKVLKSCLSRGVREGRHLNETRINFLCLHFWLFFLSLGDYRYCVSGLIGDFPTQCLKQPESCVTFFPPHMVTPRLFQLGLADFSWCRHPFGSATKCSFLVPYRGVHLSFLSLS